MTPITVMGEWINFTQSDPIHATCSLELSYISCKNMTVLWELQFSKDLNQGENTAEYFFLKESVLIL